ncbi:MAG: MBL fold metallo-hydrolase [Candidatus Heimdallarchaeota archaeon]|nr:MBL fold metallo-hydrolase [Candidatus Heimdallarchaeota archaeon]
MSNFTIVSEISGALKTNCYLLYDHKSKEAALFDVAGEINKLVKTITKEQLIVKYIFCTHLHFDHVMGIQTIREMFPDALLACNEKELDVVENMGMFAHMFQFDPKSLGEFDIFIEDNQIFSLGDLNIKTFLSPGHTPGSICFYLDEHLISGDVLFNGGVGRTDLYGGSFTELEKSIQRLFTLPETTKVYPGHGEFTDIGTEKRDNPFVSGGILQ